MSETPEDEEKDSKKYAPRRPFPIHTLEEAIKVAKAIQDKNAGKPWKPIFIADALGIKPTSNNFRDVTSSAFKYGLTDSTWNAEQISLTTLGRSLAKPIGPQQEVKAKQDAVLKVDVFKRIYEHYKDAKFPTADIYFKNMLEQEFGVPKELVDECIQLLLDNGRFASIIRDVQGSPFVVFAEAPPETPTSQEALKVELAIEKPQEPKPSPAPAQAPVINQIFVVHGKNIVTLEQLKKILTEFKIPFKVAQDEPHVGRPISQKVADLMKSCTSAVVIFTADEEYVDAEGKKICRPSDNAVYELGAASILYGNKIVILREEGLSLASDFRDLGYIPFEKDKLDAKSLDLMKEFIGIGILKVTPA
jgi:predicted nucleotide-binding protein